MALSFDVASGQWYESGTLSQSGYDAQTASPVAAPTAGPAVPNSGSSSELPGSTGAAMNAAQGQAVLDDFKKGQPNAAAYNTDNLGNYEIQFERMAENGDPAMKQILELARNQALGLGPSVAQKQSDLAVANAAANARSMAAGARGGSLGQYAAMMGGEAAAGQAAGQTAIARAAEQTGALNAYGNFTQEDVRQRSEALNNAAKTRALMMSTKQAENTANAAYWSQYATMKYNIENNMNGNSAGAINNQNAAFDFGAKLAEAGGTALAAWLKDHPGQTPPPEVVNGGYTDTNWGNANADTGSNIGDGSTIGDFPVTGEGIG